MNRWLRLLLIVLLCLPGHTTAVAAETTFIVIEAKHQVPNRWPGYCMWVSLETIGHHLGRPEMTKLSKKYAWQKTGASFTEVDNELSEIGVTHTICYWGDLEFLRDNTREGRPVLIAFNPKSLLGEHAAIVVGVTRTHVYFIDSNDPGSLYRYQIDDFTAEWCGCAVAIYPPK